MGTLWTRLPLPSSPSGLRNGISLVLPFSASPALPCRLAALQASLCPRPISWGHGRGLVPTVASSVVGQGGAGTGGPLPACRLAPVQTCLGLALCASDAHVKRGLPSGRSPGCLLWGTSMEEEAVSCREGLGQQCPSTPSPSCGRRWGNKGYRLLSLETGLRQP